MDFNIYRKLSAIFGVYPAQIRVVWVNDSNDYWTRVHWNAGDHQLCLALWTLQKAKGRRYLLKGYSQALLECGQHGVELPPV